MNIHLVGAVAVRGAYTETVWPFHILDLNCTGNERTIWDCLFNNLINIHSCSQSDDASVRCQGTNV